MEYQFGYEYGIAEFSTVSVRNSDGKILQFSSLPEKKACILIAQNPTKKLWKVHAMIRKESLEVQTDTMEIDASIIAIDNTAPERLKKTTELFQPNEEDKLSGLFTNQKLCMYRIPETEDDLNPSYTGDIEVHQTLQEKKRSPVFKTDSNDNKRRKVRSDVISESSESIIIGSELQASKVNSTNHSNMIMAGNICDKEANEDDNNEFAFNKDKGKMQATSETAGLDSVKESTLKPTNANDKSLNVASLPLAANEMKLPDKQETDENTEDENPQSMSTYEDVSTNCIDDPKATDSLSTISIYTSAHMKKLCDIKPVSGECCEYINADDFLGIGPFIKKGTAKWSLGDLVEPRKGDPVKDLPRELRGNPIPALIRSKEKQLELNGRHRLTGLFAAMDTEGCVLGVRRIQYNVDKSDMDDDYNIRRDKWLFLYLETTDVHVYLSTKLVGFQVMDQFLNSWARWNQSYKVKASSGLFCTIHRFDTKHSYEHLIHQGGGITEIRMYSKEEQDEQHPFLYGDLSDFFVLQTKTSSDLYFVNAKKGMLEQPDDHFKNGVLDEARRQSTEYNTDGWVTVPTGDACATTNIAKWSDTDPEIKFRAPDEVRRVCLINALASAMYNMGDENSRVRYLSIELKTKGEAVINDPKTAKDCGNILLGLIKHTVERKPDNGGLGWILKKISDSDRMKIETDPFSFGKIETPIIAGLEHSNHSVVLLGKHIYAPEYPRALPLNRDNLEAICGSHKRLFCKLQQFIPKYLEPPKLK